MLSHMFFIFRFYVFIQEKLSHTLARVHRYPRYYNLQERISLNLPHQQNGPVLQFVRPLLELVSFLEPVDNGCVDNLLEIIVSIFPSIYDNCLMLSDLLISFGSLYYKNVDLYQTALLGAI